MNERVLIAGLVLEGMGVGCGGEVVWQLGGMMVRCSGMMVLNISQGSLTPHLRGLFSELDLSAPLGCI
jgi:hypothetical protein